MRWARHTLWIRSAGSNLALCRNADPHAALPIVRPFPPPAVHQSRRAPPPARAYSFAPTVQVSARKTKCYRIGGWVRAAGADTLQVIDLHSPVHCARRRRNGQLLKILQKGGTSMEQLQLQNQTLSKSRQILHKLTGSGSLNPAHQFPILAACGAKQPGEVSRKDACSLALSPFEGCID